MTAKIDHRVTTDAMLIDAYLPDFDFTRVESGIVGATPDEVYDALRSLDFMSVHSALLDTAFFVRGIPMKIAGLFGKEEEEAEPETMVLGELFDHPDDEQVQWIPLGEAPGRELLFGAVGKFWQSVIEWREMAPAEFVDFRDPGYAKLAANLSIRPYGEDRSLVTYEARTQALDDEARKKFARYWRVVSPFVGHVMRAVISTLGERFEEEDLVSGRSG